MNPHAYPFTGLSAKGQLGPSNGQLLPALAVP